MEYHFRWKIGRNRTCGQKNGRWGTFGGNRQKMNGK